MKMNLKKKMNLYLFDDESKEGENNKIIPLYMNKNIKDSAFPRLLFLKENMSFGELKRKIYYYARNFYQNPFKNKEEINDILLDQELKKYKEI